MSEIETLKAELAYWQRVIGDRMGANDRRFSDMVRDLKDTLRASAPEALSHLGNVLYFGAAIHPDDRNQAFENALAFYNAACTDKQVDGQEHATLRTIHPSAATTVGPSDQAVKDATTEFLSHRGERPYRVLRGGMELWETYTAAIRAALKAAAPNRQCNCCKGMPDSVGCDCPHSRPTATSAEPVALADRIDAWSPGKNVLIFIARERRLIADALRAYATPPSSGNADAVRVADAAFMKVMLDETQPGTALEIRHRALAAALSSAPVAGEDARLEAVHVFQEAHDRVSPTEPHKAMMAGLDAVLDLLFPRNERLPLQPDTDGGAA